jgi:hypothetical protein
VDYRKLSPDVDRAIARNALTFASLDAFAAPFWRVEALGAILGVHRTLAQFVANSNLRDDPTLAPHLQELREIRPHEKGGRRSTLGHSDPP